MDTKQPNGDTWRDALLASLAISLIGATWSLLGASGCVSCRQAASILGRPNIPFLGVAFYGILLLAALRFPRRAAVAIAAMIAGGVHLTLLSVLLTNHLVCPPCFLTAAGALAATFAAVAMERRRLPWALMVVPAAAIAAYGVVFAVANASAAADRNNAMRAAEDARHPHRVIIQGHALLVAYTRENCHYCEEYHAEALPALRREFGDTLDVEERPALKGLPTPTLVILGVHGTAFPGLPTTPDLRHAVLQAQGREAPSYPPVGIPVP